MVATKKSKNTDQGDGPARLLPYSIPFPKPGEVCPISGMKRSVLYQWALPNKRNRFKPPIETIPLRVPRSESEDPKKRGKTARRGTRLIVVSSLLKFLESRKEGGQA
jgi:hypothetical protein